MTSTQTLASASGLQSASRSAAGLWSIKPCFEPTLDGPIEGLALVELFGFNKKSWEYKGDPMTGSLTRRFKLEGVGNCANLDAVRTSLGVDVIPQGQWLEAFRKAYPQNDGKGPIGIADPSWVDPSGRVRFPVLFQNGSDWSPHFDWASSSRNAGWRWLVEVK